MNQSTEQELRKMTKDSLVLRYLNLQRERSDLERSKKQLEEYAKGDEKEISKLRTSNRELEEERNELKAKKIEHTENERVGAAYRTLTTMGHNPGDYKDMPRWMRGGPHGGFVMTPMGPMPW